MEKTTYKEGQFVFRVGESPDKMFLLVNGSIGIFLPTNETTVPNFILQENELFGEMGVIENELRMASARCLKESIIISVTKVKVSVDLSIARIYLSIFPSSNSEDQIELIQRGSFKYKQALSKIFKNNLFKIPNLHFHNDDSLDYIEKIENALKGKDNPIINKSNSKN